MMRTIQTNDILAVEFCELSPSARAEAIAFIDHYTALRPCDVQVTKAGFYTTLTIYPLGD